MRRSWEQMWETWEQKWQTEERMNLVQPSHPSTAKNVKVMTLYNNPTPRALLADVPTQAKQEIEVRFLVLEHVVNIAAIVEMILGAWLRANAQLGNIGSMICRSHQNIADLAPFQMRVLSNYPCNGRRISLSESSFFRKTGVRQGRRGVRKGRFRQSPSRRWRYSQSVRRRYPPTDILCRSQGPIP